MKSFGGGVAFVDPELKKIAKKWGMQPSWTKIAALSLSLLLAVSFSKRKVLMKKHNVILKNRQLGLQKVSK